MQARKNQRTKGTMLHNRGKGSFHSKGVNSFAAIKGVLFQIFSLARSSCDLGITFSTIKMNARKNQRNYHICHIGGVVVVIS